MTSYLESWLMLYQINSNACKFTPTGGKLTISTHLVLPTPPSRSSMETQKVHNKMIDGSDSLSAEHLTQHDLFEYNYPSIVERIVVRIEVTDTGWGIRPQDMAQTKLFCA
jgi:osomolarity two-component system sensor histidine kinase SLN1